VSGEQEMPIPPLEMVDPASDVQTLTQSGSIHLFIERAQAVRPDFELTSDNAASVAKLVNRLDGLPLAIELVVPKLKLLAVDAILERLDTRSLAGGVRDAPERHQTLWNAISWSVDSLPDQARRLFVHFSVFAGGGRLDEVESVCAATAGVDVLDALATLVDHSLVVRDGEDRFRMLQVIREYASEMLTESGETDAFQDRHAEAYLKRIERAFPELTGKDRRAWLESLDRDHDNFRAAISYCVRVGDVDRALRFAWSMWRYWQIRGHLYEARHRVEEVLVLPGGELPLRAKAMEALGSIAWWQGDIDTSEEAYGEALRMQREGGDDREIANALYNKGLVHALFREDPDGGDEILKEALAIYERLGDPGGLADVHWGLANLSIFGHEEPRAGVAHLEDSIAGYRQVGNVFGEGWAQFEMGEAHRRLEEVDTAWEHYCAGLRLLYGSGDISATVLFLMGFAAMALGSGDRDRAVRLAGAAWAFGDRSGIDLISIRANRVEGLERETLEALDGDLAAAYQEGRRLSYDEAVEYALGNS
jgi:tetratricopeptide (TPR) repeat protein